MFEHEPGCRRQHGRRQRCDTPPSSDSTETTYSAPTAPRNEARQSDGIEWSIDRGRVQTCFIALPLLLPFILFLLLFAGDSGPHSAFWYVMTLTTMVCGFFVMTYLVLTVIDWIGKRI